MSAPRFLYIDDIPTPYRLGVFRRFASIFPGTFRIGFLAASEPGRDWSLSLDGLDTVVIPGMQWRPARQRTPFSYKWNPGISRLIRAWRPDVVAVSGYVHPSIQLATHTLRRMGIPYGVSCESSLLQGPPSGLRWALKRGLLGPCVRGMRFGLPCGTQAEAYLRALGAKHQPMYYFPNTPDVRDVQQAARVVADPVERSAFLGELGIPDGIRRILFVGRLIDVKRPMDLLQAYAGLPESLRASTALVLAGDGDLKHALQERAREVSPGHVFFPGWLPPEQVHRLMALADLFVLPSGHEPWGAVVNESLAAGTPVIASDRVGAAYDLVIPSRTGWRFPAGDRAALSAQLQRSLGQPELLSAMRQWAREEAERQGADFAAGNLLRAVASVSP